MSSQSLNTCTLPYLDIYSKMSMLDRVSSKRGTIAMHDCPLLASILLCLPEHDLEKWFVPAEASGNMLLVMFECAR